MTLFLVRHGRAASGIDDLDPGLDEVGRAQALAAGAALRNAGAARLICSPLRRTRETAGPIALATGLDIEIRSEVSEVFAPSQTPGDRMAMLGPLLGGRWSDQPEPLRGWRQQVVDALVAIGGQGTAIVVSHFVAIGVAIGEAEGSDAVVPAPVPNASITTLDVLGDRLVLRAAGGTSHLDGSLVTGALTGRSGLPVR